MITLGDEVKDSVSGFSGIAIAKHSYPQGCDRFCVQPKVNKDGTLPVTENFDGPQLTLLKHHKVKGNGETTLGGPERYLDTKRK